MIPAQKDPYSHRMRRVSFEQTVGRGRRDLYRHLGHISQRESRLSVDSLVDEDIELPVHLLNAFRTIQYRFFVGDVHL